VSLEDLRHTLSNDYRNCLVNSCRKEGCRLRIGSLGSKGRFIIDGDKYIEHHKQTGGFCDYVVFHFSANVAVGVVEMKSGRVDASDAVKQIRNGTAFTEELVKSIGQVKYYPVLLHGRGIHRIELGFLKKHKVRFQGQDFSVIVDMKGLFRNLKMRFLNK